MPNFYDQVKNFTMVDIARLQNLASAIDIVKNDKIEGDFVECGSWKCGTLGFMSIYSKSIGLNKKIMGFDSFEGLPAPAAVDGDSAKQWTGQLSISIDHGYDNLRQMGAEDVKLFKGFFEETLSSNKNEIQKISILRIDCDWYSSTKTCLDELYELVSPGGFVIIDDYGHWQGCKKAVDEFREKLKIDSQLFRTDYTEHWWRK